MGLVEIVIAAATVGVIGPLLLEVSISFEKNNSIKDYKKNDDKKDLRSS